MPVKKINGLPDLEEIESRIAQEESKEKPKKPKGIRIALVGLSILAAALAVINLTATTVLPSIAGTGSISGNVVNLQQTPVPAEVYLLKMDISATTDAGGYFLLNNVPAGEVRLIVAYDGMSREIPVQVIAGQNVTVGQVRVEETEMPLEGE
jgi:hypothetical protein